MEDAKVDKAVSDLAQHMSHALVVLSEGGPVEVLQGELENVQEDTSRLLTMIDEGEVDDFVGYAVSPTATAPDTVPDNWTGGT